MDSYLLHGDRFNQNDITYYIDPRLSYAAGIEAAIERWDALLSVDFVESNTRFGTDVFITDAFLDGSGGTLGVAEWFTNGAGSINSSTITFDRAEFYQSGDLELYKVALHELGHVLGLDHPNDPGVLMNAFISPYLTDLAPGDITGAQYIYGSEDGSVLPGGGSAPVSGWSYEYSLQWQNGWNVGWSFGWTVGWNVSWYVNYTMNEFTYSWQITGQPCVQPQL